MSTAYSSAKQQYIGNGATTEWGFDFPIQKHSELKVYLRRSGQSQVLLEEGVDYSFVTENTIAFPIKTGEAKLQAADVLALQRESVFESEYNFSNQQRLEPEEVMNSDDNLERQIQELKRDSESAIKVLPTSNVDPNTFFEHVERVYGSVDNIDTVANDKANVDAVAGSITNVNTVAGDIESVKTVANNIESVVIDATNISDIKTVAGSIANVNKTAGSIDNVNVVAPSIASVNTVAPKVNDVTTVATNIVGVNTVADSVANVNRVGNSIANVNKVAGIADEVDQVAMIADQTRNVGDNISDVMTVASVSEQVKTVSANAASVKAIGDNIDTVLQSPENTRKANIWAEGNDSQVESLGGTHSAKVWASIAASVAQIDSASETSQGVARIATADEAIAGANDLTIVTPLKAKYIAEKYAGKVVQLGFNGVLKNNVLTFNPDQDPYEINAGYEYEIDLLFPAAGTLPDNTKMVIKNGADTVQIVNVRHANASTPITYGDMKQICRYDAGIGWRWVFNARFAVTDTGVKVLVMPSYAFQDDRYVTTDTNQTISANKKLSVGGTATYSRPIEILMPTSTDSNPTETKIREIAFISSEGTGNNYEGSLTHSHFADGTSYTGLRAGRVVNGTYKDAAIGVRITSDGTTFGTAPNTPANAPANAITTVDYVKNNFVDKTSTQTISGSKRFTQPSPGGMSIELVADTNQQSIPTTPALRQLGIYRNSTYTKGDGYTSWIQGLRGSDGWTETKLFTRRFLENDSQEILNYLKVDITPEGTPISYTKTPPAGCVDEEITTAGWVRNLLKTSGQAYTWSNNQNGYIKFSNGFIIQWGHGGANRESQYGWDTITYPIAFTSFQVAQATMYNNDTTWQGDASQTSQGSIKRIGLTGMQCYYTNSNGFDWIAVGF